MSISRYNTKNNKNKKPKGSVVSLTTTMRLTRPTHDYVDWSAVVSVSTTAYSYSLLDILRTQLLPGFQRAWRPSIEQNTGRQLYAKIKIPYIDFSLVFTGAQATTLLAGDLINSIRYTIFKIGSKAATAPVTVITDINNFCSMDTLLKQYLDTVVPLPTQAFDSANGYNVPLVVRHQFRLYLNDILDWYTQDGSGSTNWDTKRNNLVFQCVSDSTVTPHPTIGITSRVYYRPIMR
jgi:hypothetical protein